MPSKNDPKVIPTNPLGSEETMTQLTRLLESGRACGVKSLAYEGLVIEWHSPQDAGDDDQPLDDAGDRPGDDLGEYVLARTKNDAPQGPLLPAEVAEVVNLAQDYDRWDRYEAGPVSEGD
jgi:hypothetical protein